METSVKIIGGIGLFLLGMSLLTDGLKEVAGDSLRRRLLQATRTPLKAFLSGALVTMLVQSSSATTIAVIGFVSAGLLTFPQALGLVFGASLGTTGTSWIVAWIGLKIKVGLYALPFVGIGALIRLLGRGRWAAVGTSLAGFGLIFLGINTLQTGMQDLAAYIDLAALPNQGVLGVLVALILGLVMTVILQSSSAAVATTLTALDAQAINLHQAAAIVIGASVGTTVTGALAALGASTSAKRTALSHVAFNAATGAIALVLLPWFIRFMLWTEDHWHFGNAAALAAFHTVFIALGAMIFLPFVGHFSRFIEWLIPDHGPRLTRHLDRHLLATPAFALVATRLALRDTAIETLRGLVRGLRFNHWDAERGKIDEAVTQIQAYLESLPVTANDPALTKSRLDQVHAIDHLRRLSGRLIPPGRVRVVLSSRPLAALADRCRESLELGLKVLEQQPVPGWEEKMLEVSQTLATIRQEQRPALIEEAAVGARGPADTLNAIDAYRWLDRVSHHAWRVCAYLAAANGDSTATRPLSRSVSTVSPSGKTEDDAAVPSSTD